MTQDQGKGFAAATPPQATAIRTDTVGLRCGDVRIGPDKEPLSAYFAAPEGAGPFPVVLVVQEIFGVHEHIRDVVRRLAHAGYLAVAPELYFRQGDPSVLPSVGELFEKIVSHVPDEQVFGDLDACIRWAEGNGGDITHLGVTGFCWGGRITWLYAARQPRVKAGVAWYGKLVGPINELTTRQPLDVAIGLQTPVLGLYGADDASIPLDTVSQMQEQLATAGSPSEIIVYPGAGHAFHADYRPSYHEPSAKDGWTRLLKWFERWL